MILYDQQVYKALDNILWHVNVVQGYPKEWNDFPIISYINETNNTAVKCDGEEYITYLVYTVHFFYTNETADDRYIPQIDKAMTSIGFKRDNMQMLYEGEGIHVVFRYSMYASKDGFAYDTIY